MANVISKLTKQAYLKKCLFLKTLIIIKFVNNERSEVRGSDSPYDLFLQPKIDAECGLRYKYHESITKEPTINSILKQMILHTVLANRFLLNA